MTAHLMQEELAGWVEKNLNPQSLLRVGRHLSGCEECQQKLREFAVTAEPEITREIGPPLHLSDELLMGFVAGSYSAVPERRLHLSFCTECQRQLENLHEFENRTGAIPSSVSTRSYEAWLTRFANLLCSPSLRFAPLASMLLGAAVLLSGLLQRLPESAATRASSSLNDFLLRQTNSAFARYTEQMYAGLALLCAAIVLFLLRRAIRGQRRNTASRT